MSSEVEFRILLSLSLRALVKCIWCHERVDHRSLGGFSKNTCHGVFHIKAINFPFGIWNFALSNTFFYFF